MSDGFWHVPPNRSLKSRSFHAWLQRQKAVQKAASCLRGQRPGSCFFFFDTGDTRDRYNILLLYIYIYIIIYLSIYLSYSTLPYLIFILSYLIYLSINGLGLRDNLEEIAHNS